MKMLMADFLTIKTQYLFEFYAEEMYFPELNP